MKYQPKGQLVAGFLTLGIMTAGLYGGVAILASLSPDPDQAVAAAKESFPKHVSLGDKTLVAKAAILFDPATNEVLYQKNATEPLPLASLTKLITAQTVLSEREPQTPVTVTQNDIREYGAGLRAGDTLSLQNLIRLGLIVSSNSAMAAAANALGSSSLEAINAHAAELNLTHTVVYDPTGLDVSTTTAGAYGSAYDVAHLAAVFYKDHPDYFELTQTDKVAIAVDGHTVGGTATAAPLLSTPGLVGAKTGYTDLAGGNLVAVFDVDIGHPIVGVVLGSTETGRFDDMKTLITSARQSL